MAYLAQTKTRRHQVTAMASLLGQRVSYLSQSTGMKQEYWVVGARVLAKSSVNMCQVVHSTAQGGDSRIGNL